MTGVSERYVEQLYTTGETIRRRMITYCDGLVYYGKTGRETLNFIHQSFEPVTLDSYDYIKSAWNVTEPISRLNVNVLFTLVELYLAITTSMMVFSCGEFIGVSGLTTVLDPFVNKFLVFNSMVAGLGYLTWELLSFSDKNKQNILTISFCTGLTIGYVCGSSVLNLVPATYFIPPFLLALLIDNELIKSSMIYLDRHSFFTLIVGSATVLCTGAAMVPLGTFSLKIVIGSIIHSLCLILHFQVSQKWIEEKTFDLAVSQLVYVGIVSGIQILLIVILT